MFFLGLIIPTAYWPSLTGNSILSGWPVLSIALPFMFLRKVRMGLGHWLGLAFLAYAFGSMLWAPVFSQGIWDLWLLSIFAGCFMLGAQLSDPRPLYAGLALGVGVSTILSVIQHYGIFLVTEAGWPGCSHPGLFYNYDIFGETAALASVALVGSRLYWPLALTVPPIFLTGSRTALVATFVALALWLWDIDRWYGLLMAGALGLLALGAIYTFSKPDTCGSLTRTSSTSERLAIWRDTADGLTVLGRGPGSFLIDYPLFASRTDTMLSRPEAAHNDYLELLFEFGLGVAPLVGLLALALTSPATDRYLLIAFLVTAFFAFPIREPTEALLGAVALGRCSVGWDLSWLYRLLRRSPSGPWLRQARSIPISVEQVHPHMAGI
jgi:hypothetical protein